MSHFDGISPVAFTCGICGLKCHEQVRGNDIICQPCSRFQVIQRLSNTFGRYSLTALLIGIAILVFDAFSAFNFLLPVLAIVFLIPVVISTGFVQLQIYQGIRSNDKIAHQLRYFSLLNHNEGTFYQAAEDNVEHDEPINENLQHIIIYYLVEGLIFDNKPKPQDYLSKWASGMGIDEAQLIRYMFEYTEIEEAFSYNKGVGVLPDFWPYIGHDKEMRDIIFDRLAEAAADLENASKNEKLYFLEDLFLIEEEILDYLDSKPEWEIIAQVLEEFEPEAPPKNLMESFMAQANENARLMEQKNQTKQASAIDTLDSTK